MLCDFVPFPQLALTRSAGHEFRESTPRKLVEIVPEKDSQEVEPKPYLFCKIINDLVQKKNYEIYI